MSLFFTAGRAPMCRLLHYLAHFIVCLGETGGTTYSNIGTESLVIERKRRRLTFEAIRGHRHM